jgi:hypothetical protein
MSAPSEIERPSDLRAAVQIKVRVRRKEDNEKIDRVLIWAIGGVAAICVIGLAFYLFGGRSSPAPTPVAEVVAPPEVMTGQRFNPAALDAVCAPVGANGAKDLLASPWKTGSHSRASSVQLAGVPAFLVCAATEALDRLCQPAHRAELAGQLTRYAAARASLVAQSPNAMPLSAAMLQDEDRLIARIRFLSQAGLLSARDFDGEVPSLVAPNLLPQQIDRCAG